MRIHSTSTPFVPEHPINSKLIESVRLDALTCESTDHMALNCVVIIACCLRVAEVTLTILHIEPMVIKDATLTNGVQLYYFCFCVDL